MLGKRGLDKSVSHDEVIYRDGDSSPLIKVWAETLLYLSRISMGGTGGGPGGGD